MQKESFKLRKRYRHQEEYVYLYTKQTWTKSILNVEGGTVLGRTPIGWLLLLIFYVIFMGSTALLWYLCYIVFDKTLYTNKPKWSLQQPGFCFEPSILKTKMNIDYYEHLEAEIDMYVDRITEVLRKYGNVTDSYFGMCKPDSNYGYKQRDPCVFLKINRIIGFKTEPIERSEDLPADAPKELRMYIEELPKEDRENRIWVSCEAKASESKSSESKASESKSSESKASESKSSLNIEYYPQRYFTTKHVDHATEIRHRDVSEEYKNEFGYENSLFYNHEDFKRIIAVRLPHVEPNVKYSVLCNAWAKNIERDGHGRGMVRFQLLVKL